MLKGRSLSTLFSISFGFVSLALKCSDIVGSSVLLKTLTLEFALQLAPKYHLEEPFNCALQTSEMDPN